MIRFILALIFVILFLVCSVPILLAELLVHKINPMAADLSQLRIVQWAFRCVIFIAGPKITIIGEENVPKDQPVLFIGNHQGFFDVVISYSRMPNRTGYIAKKSFEKIPLLSSYMKRLYCLFLDRNDLKQGLKTILRAIDYVKGGVSIFIFPEGTRNKSGDELNLGPFHDGSFKIAQRTGCPIVPVSFSHTEAVFEKQFPKLRPAHVVVEYGKPVCYGDLSKDEQKHIGEHFRNILLEMLKKNQSMV